MERGPYTPDEALAQLRRLQARPWGWVIEAGGEVVGHIAVDRLDPERRTGFVSMGLLRSDLLGRGLGSAALRALVGRAADPPLSFASLHLRVAEYNARGIAAYRKCGFVEVGRTERGFELDGRWVADIIMRRDLP